MSSRHILRPVVYRQRSKELMQKGMACRKSPAIYRGQSGEGNSRKGSSLVAELWSEKLAFIHELSNPPIPCPVVNTSHP